MLPFIWQKRLPSHTRINLCTGIFPFVAQPSLWESLFCSAQLATAANGLLMAARVGLVIPRWKVCSMWHLPSAAFHRRRMELMVPPLISLCKVFYFCWHSQSSGLDAFMTQPDVNVSFPCSATASSPLLPPRYSALICCLYLSFPHLLALWQKDQSRKLSSAWQSPQKWAQSTTGTRGLITQVLPALPSCC